jgi:hypothetical protein
MVCRLVLRKGGKKNRSNAEGQFCTVLYDNLRVPHKDGMEWTPEPSPNKACTGEGVLLIHFARDPYCPISTFDTFCPDLTISPFIILLKTPFTR